MADPRRATNIGQPESSAEGRIPPQAVDVEMAVLGAMLLDKGAIVKAIEILDDTSFYKPAHQRIFIAMSSLFEHSEPVDLITLVEELRRRGELEIVGGEYYLTELTTRITTAANIEYYAHIVLEKALMRQLISASSEVTSRAFNETEDALDLLDEAEQKIFQISDWKHCSMGHRITETLHISERGISIGAFERENFIFPSGWTLIKSQTGSPWGSPSLAG